MISTSERIADLLFGLSFFVFLFYLVNRRPVIFVGFFFIIFTLAWRMAATMYIDLAGPVYSSQLVRSIGPGTATVVHSIAYVVSLIPFLYFFRQSAIDRWCTDAQRSRPAASGEISLSDLTFVLSLIFLIFLFFDLVHRGTIPLFNQIERFNYTGGPAHRWINRYGNFVTFWWGLMFAAAYIRRGRFDWRFPGLMCALAAYAFLTGNRFSAFYSQFSFFITPWAAVVALQNRTSDGAWFSWIRRSFASRASRLTAAGALVALAGLISFAIYNNLANVRGYKDSEIWHQAFERTLIQPSEIGWTSFERVFEDKQLNPSLTFHFLFEDPVDPARNTSIQYLMFESIGEPRTTDQILRGFQFAGGFPEIFFELFGLYFAWPFLLGAGCIAAALTAYVVRGTLRGDYVSAFLSLYILFGFYVMYIGGMLNFVLVETYWIKIATLALALSIERRLARAGLSLLPWVLFRVRTPRWIGNS
ncbi:DUF6418 domain-containing protein [Bradyrhizobium canariense]|uniref:DUF6418 domain-containing protein n=1 Tax=Bradyrhizobium canariense TaxID=255045 RepID=A0A1H1M4U6_9BRAD|nr:DUF6418 domain-containing protein [Bradyrhizobium canariense]SDR81766.1 hypothetical protein SAMN05444158_0091 [Bradyrhizobium canariense]